MARPQTVRLRIFPGNPVLTNRNLGGYQIQGAGHGDLVDDGKGNWFLIHLAFRQLNSYTQHHTMGREVYLTPVHFGQDGWFTAGNDGTARLEMSAPSLIDIVQQPDHNLTFANTQLHRQWVNLRNPEAENYVYDGTALKLRPSAYPLEEMRKSPTALFIRQAHLKMTVSVRVDNDANLVGLTAYMEHDQHYDIVVWREDEQVHAARRLHVGPALVLDHEVILEGTPVILKIEVSPDYHLVVENAGQQYDFGFAQARFLSSELAGNFTGVMFGLFAEENQVAPQWNTFSDFHYTIANAEKK